MKSITDVQTTVSEKILAFKKAEKMTFDDLGEITGINPATIRSWVRYSQVPNLYNAYLIADAMGLSLQELIE